MKLCMDNLLTTIYSKYGVVLALSCYNHMNTPNFNLDPVFVVSWDTTSNTKAIGVGILSPNDFVYLVMLSSGNTKCSPPFQHLNWNMIMFLLSLLIHLFNYFRDNHHLLSHLRRQLSILRLHLWTCLLPHHLIPHHCIFPTLLHLLILLLLLHHLILHRCLHVILLPTLPLWTLLKCLFCLMNLLPTIANPPG